MTNTLIVNLLGGSGCGKSKTACRLFAMLKDDYIDCELVNEYVKDMVWEGRNKVFECQPYIFGKQYYKLFRVNGKVEVIITDRPIFLDLVYGDSEGKHFKQHVLEKFRSFNNLNVYLNRVDSFNPNGRNESNIEEARICDNKIIKCLKETKTPYIIADGNKEGCEFIYKIIKGRLKYDK